MIATTRATTRESGHARHTRRRPLAALIALWALLAWSPAQAETTVLQIDLNGVIGPAALDYLDRALTKAQKNEAEALLVRMDTPGGPLESTRLMIQKILHSSVPVVLYVAPAGARAASAGTFLMYASHVAAMAPTTHLGAATPVRLQVGLAIAEQDTAEQDTEEQDSFSEETGETEEKEKGQEKERSWFSNEEALHRKATNDAVALIRNLAKLRGRNADWAEKAVREAASLTAEEALERNVIDRIAKNTTSLLEQIDGMEVSLGDDQIVRLETTDAILDVYKPDLRYQILSLLTNPVLLFLLGHLVVLGFIFEMQNPGLILPGMVGLISLFLLLYGVHILPIEKVGLLFIFLGIVFLVLEIFIPSMGLLSVGGAASLALGFVMSLRETLELHQYTLWLFGLLFFLALLPISIVIILLRRMRHHPTVSGMEELVGSVGQVLEVDGKHCRVLLHSENWKGRCDEPLQPGQQVRVKAIHGLTLDLSALPTEE